MTKAKLVHVDKDNAEFDNLGIFDLEIIPRIGERIRLSKNSEDDPKSYVVDEVLHSIPAERPLEIWVVTPEWDK
jgi:hypothetical protein